MTSYSSLNNDSNKPYSSYTAAPPPSYGAVHNPESPGEAAAPSPSGSNGRYFLYGLMAAMAIAGLVILFIFMLDYSGSSSDDTWILAGITLLGTTLLVGGVLMMANLSGPSAECCETTAAITYGAAAIAIAVSESRQRH